MALQAFRVSGSYPAVNESLLRLAERELSTALLAQERPMTGMYVRQSSAADAALARAAHALCEEGHRRDARVEELLVALKQAWANLATTRARHLGDRDGDVLRQVVSTTIEVFFEQRAPADGDRN